MNVDVLAKTCIPFENDKQLATVQVDVWAALLPEIAMIRNLNKSVVLEFSTKEKSTAFYPEFAIRGEPATDRDVSRVRAAWKAAAVECLLSANLLERMGVEEEVWGKLLVPFQFARVYLTGTDWSRLGENLGDNDRDMRWLVNEIEQAVDAYTTTQDAVHCPNTRYWAADIDHRMILSAASMSVLEEMSCEPESKVTDRLFSFAEVRWESNIREQFEHAAISLMAAKHFIPACKWPKEFRTGRVGNLDGWVNYRFLRENGLVRYFKKMVV